MPNEGLLVRLGLMYIVEFDIHVLLVSYFEDCVGNRRVGGEGTHATL
jgi:hypothetical protein